MTIRPGLLLLALAASPIAAQSLHLSKSGGAVPGSIGLGLQGTPGEIYVLLGATHEQPTQPLPGLSLEIPLDLLSFFLAQPGFIGLLGPLGAASASLGLPADPGLIGITASFQGVMGPDFTIASNLVRVTTAAPGTFAPTLDAPDLPIAGGAIAPDADGRLLFVGGSGPAVQRYDPDLEQWDLSGTAFGIGTLSQATALGDGRVLFTGGLGTDGQPSDFAAVFDPATGQSTTLAMLHKRAGHGAALLGNGKVLITGGFETLVLTDLLALFQGVQASTELFDPASGTFAAGPNMLEARALHTTTSLNDGGALVAGGLSLLPIVLIPTVSSTAYQFSPAGAFGLPKLMNGGRLLHSAVRLSNGKVFIAGGLSVDFAEAIATGDLTKIKFTSLTDCQVYTPGLFSGFATVPGLSTGRAGAGLVALPGNRALVAGGFSVVLDLASLLAGQFDVVASADLYDGTQILPTGAMSAPRVMPLGWSLPDGTVMVAGGGPLEAEIYQP